MASKKTFVELGVGEMFIALGERYIKISPLSYRSLDNPTLGEQPYGPILDRQMWKDAPGQTINTKVTVTADPETLETAAAMNQTPAPKKTTKKSAKKSTKKSK